MFQSLASRQEEPNFGLHLQDREQLVGRMEAPGTPPQRPYLRARRRVRQRVDAGEPRNSYSSIPGFSFRHNQMQGHLPRNNSASSNHHLSNRLQAYHNFHSNNQKLMASHRDHPLEGKAMALSNNNVTSSSHFGLTDNVNRCDDAAMYHMNSSHSSNGSTSANHLLGKFGAKNMNNNSISAMTPNHPEGGHGVKFLGGSPEMSPHHPAPPPLQFPPHHHPYLRQRFQQQFYRGMLPQMKARLPGVNGGGQGGPFHGHHQFHSQHMQHMMQQAAAAMQARAQFLYQQQRLEEAQQLRRRLESSPSQECPVLCHERSPLGESLSETNHENPLAEEESEKSLKTNCCQQLLSSSNSSGESLHDHGLLRSRSNLPLNESDAISGGKLEGQDEVRKENNQRLAQDTREGSSNLARIEPSSDPRGRLLNFPGEEDKKSASKHSCIMAASPAPFGNLEEKEALGEGASGRADGATESASEASREQRDQERDGYCAGDKPCESQVVVAGVCALGADDGDDRSGDKENLRCCALRGAPLTCLDNEDEGAGPNRATTGKEADDVDHVQEGQELTKPDALLDTQEEPSLEHAHRGGAASAQEDPRRASDSANGSAAPSTPGTRAPQQLEEDDGDVKERRRQEELFRDSTSKDSDVVTQVSGNNNSVSSTTDSHHNFVRQQHRETSSCAVGDCHLNPSESLVHHPPSASAFLGPGPPVHPNFGPNHLTPKPFARLCYPPLPLPPAGPHPFLGSPPPHHPPPLYPPVASNAHLLLREVLHGKLALAAAVAQRQYFHGDPHSNPEHTAKPIMEPGLGVMTNGHHSPRDFSATRHNNNDLKESTAASIMSHFLKVRQEMALNMSMDRDAPQPSSSPKRIEDEEEDDELVATMEEEDSDLPLDLQDKTDPSKNDDGRNSVQSGSDAELNAAASASPQSPAGSEAGMSSSSGKDSKSARLESIVSSMRSSPLPPVNGCKKRKLYQPVQHEREVSSSSGGGGKNEDKAASSEDVVSEGENDKDENRNREEPEEKRKKKEDHLRQMQEQLGRFHHQRMNMHQRGNDENTDPSDHELRIMAEESRRKVEMSRGKQHLSQLFNGLGGPGTQLPGFPPRENMNPLQLQYMEMARRVMQEQQDKLTKEAITKEIINETITHNSEIAEKLVAISPELKGLADILKTEITASLAIIIDSIVGRFLQNRRQNQHQQHQHQQQKQLHHAQLPSSIPPHPALGKPFSMDDPLGLKFDSPKLHGHSGRAPQVRDRAAPRLASNPLSMASPLTLNHSINTAARGPSNSSQSIPASIRPPSSSTSFSDMMMNNNKERSEREMNSPSIHSDITARDDDSDNMPEQDEALSLVVTPKKKRHKVTDTRITPRSVSRALCPESTDLTKSPFGLPFPGLKNCDSPSPRPLFPGMTPPGLLPHGLPTSVAIPNPSLHDFNPFSPFFNPAAAAAAAAAAAHSTPRVSSVSTPIAAAPSSPSPSSRKDRDSPQILHRPFRGSSSPSSADFAANLREASESAQEEYERVQSSLPYSLSSYSLEAHSATLTPMHLRKAKLMFFWVRYPSSAILKMYFPDIKFNKNNTAQLVKWFSNFREFYYIQMEKYARQALSEGIKNPEDIHVTLESELYRVLNLHYNRNNHIEVPDHFLPVVEATLREFFLSIREGKDAEASWKKQIYKIIARYDEPIPDYFKTKEFLKQLE